MHTQMCVCINFEDKFKLLFNTRLQIIFRSQISDNNSQVFYFDSIQHLKYLIDQLGK